MQNDFGRVPGLFHTHPFKIVLQSFMAEVGVASAVGMGVQIAR